MSNTIVFTKKDGWVFCYEEDALVVHQLTNYKIYKWNGVQTVSFPVVSIRKVTDLLRRKGINYEFVTNNKNSQKSVSLGNDKPEENVEKTEIKLENKNNIVSIENGTSNLIDSKKVEQDETVKSYYEKKPMFIASKLAKTILYGITAIALLTLYITSSSNLNIFKPFIINSDRRSTILESLIDKNVERSFYTPKSYKNYYKALSNGERIMEMTLVDESDIEEATVSLEKAISGLRIRANKKDLVNNYRKYENYDYSIYTRSSVDTFSTILENVKKVTLDKNIVQSEADIVEHLLSECFNKLIIRGNNIELNELLVAYNQLNKEEYLSKSFAPFDVVLSEANNLVDNDDMSQRDVDNLVEELRTVYSELERKPDKTQLFATIDNCTNMLQENYTDESWSYFYEEIEKAKIIADNDEATAADVSEAMSIIGNARNNLKSYTIGIYRLDCHASKETNNHVGNDWDYNFYLNGGYISGYSTVKRRFGETATIKCQIIENDKIPDYGSGYTTIRFEDGYETSFRIWVTENNGRYAGNSDSFNVTVEITLIGRE